jgi:pilus assembly protein CpaC
MRIRDRIASSLLILLIAVATPGVVFADDLPPVRLLVGRSTVVDVGTPITRVSLTSAEVADAMVTSSNQLLINGKMPGTISMFVWERGGALRQYEVIVQRDLARLNEQIKRLFPGEGIEAQSNGKSIVLSGMVSSKELSGKASSVAAGYVDKPEDVVNLLGLQEGNGSNQVLLRVRFAEVSRTAITDLGTSLFTGAGGYKDLLARSTTSTPAPVFENSDPTNQKLVFSDFLNLFLFDTKHQLGAVIKALQTRGQFQSLAEPNLVAESGKEASFLAGGEFPVPIAQGSGANVVISVQYKEFGVRLNFTPVIHGDRVHLKVKPEVSTLDFANGVQLQGFRIPALSTRRTETELDLQDGQTFAIAGLLNNSMNSTLQKIPGIGDIPILGLLFKSKAANKDQTELVVMITPQILTRNSSGVTTTLPSTPEPFLAPLPAKKLVEPLPPAFTPARSSGAAASPTAAVSAPPPAFAAPRPSDDGSAARAAAKVKALIPTTNPVPYVAPAQSQPAASQPAAPLPARQLTNDERATLERSVKPAETARSVEPGTRNNKQAEAESRKEKDEQERQAKVANEQASRDEKAAREKARLDAKAANEEAKLGAKAANEEARLEAKAAKEQAERDAREAKEQAKRDAKAGRLAGEQAKRQAEVAAQQAKRKAELDKEHQKALDEAAAKARAAEAKYQAELKRQL